jgi:hypothetical protein
MKKQKEIVLYAEDWEPVKNTTARFSFNKLFFFHNLGLKNNAFHKIDSEIESGGSGRRS